MHAREAFRHHCYISPAPPASWWGLAWRGTRSPSRAWSQREAACATREALLDAANPLGLDGIEFVEYATPKPQALGQVLEMMGFRPVARHRSREVLLYRQGT